MTSVPVKHIQPYFYVCIWPCPLTLTLFTFDLFMNFFLVTFFLVSVMDGQTDGQKATHPWVTHEHRWAKKLYFLIIWLTCWIGPKFGTFNYSLDMFTWIDDIHNALLCIHINVRHRYIIDPLVVSVRWSISMLSWCYTGLCGIRSRKLLIDSFNNQLQNWEKSLIFYR